MQKIMHISNQQRQTSLISKYILGSYKTVYKRFKYAKNWKETFVNVAL